MQLRSLAGLRLVLGPARSEIVHTPSGQRWQADILSHPVALELLRRATGQPVDRSELIVEACHGESSLLPTASAIAWALIEAGLLVEATGLDPDQEAAERWAAWGWRSAFDYHRHTTGIELLDYGTRDSARLDREWMAGFLAASAPPPLYLDRDGPLLQLPAPQPDRVETTVAELYVGAARPHNLDLAGLSDFCFLCFGETGRINFPVTGRQLLKSVPSGGSRHPTEAYLLVLDVTGVPRGTYHYSVRQHALEQVSSDDPEKIALEHCLVHTERLTFPPALVVVLTSRPERSMYRYRESRSYRVLHLDAGHLLFNAAMVAGALGWSSYRAYSPAEHAVEPVLAVDGVTEFTIGTIAVGRP